MRRLLVTGAEGFVGRRLVQYLRQCGFDVVAGVRNRARKLAYERDQVPALVCDVTDAINVARVVASARPDAIIHTAGVSRPELANAEPLTAYQSIVTSWANLLDAVRRTVPRARVLLVSASDVYGETARDGHAVGECDELRPIGTFGALKRTAESIAHTFFRNYHLNLTIARPFLYAGAGQSEATYLGAVAAKLQDWDWQVHGAELSLPDLQCQRDWLHVEDVAHAYVRLLQDGRPDEVYNVCSGQTTSMRDLVASMADQFGYDVRLLEQVVAENGEGLAKVCGDNRRIRDELGWTPKRTVFDAVSEMVMSYRSQNKVAKAGVRQA